MKRPQTRRGVLTATRMDATMLELLGGQTRGKVGFTSDQAKHFNRIYKFEDEGVAFHQKEGADTYEFRFQVEGKDHSARCESCLSNLGFEFSSKVKKEEHLKEKTVFTVTIPRGFSGSTMFTERYTEKKFTLPSWETLRRKKVGSLTFMQMGADRNLMRHVEADGLRVMGCLARHLEIDEDPVQFVLQAMAICGYDVAMDFDEEEEDSEEEVA